MLLTSKKNKKKTPDLNANYDIGTYEGYLMWKNRQLDIKEYLLTEFKRLNPKNLNYRDWIKQERSQVANFLKEKGYNVTIIAEFLEISVEEDTRLI
jgi:hypothetical protein